MASFLLDRGVAPPALTSQLPPSHHATSSLSTSSSSPSSSSSSLPFTLPPGTIALPGPSGSIVWAAPQPFVSQPSAATSPPSPYQLLQSSLLQLTQPSGGAAMAPTTFPLSSLPPTASLQSLPPLSQLSQQAVPHVQGGGAGGASMFTPSTLPLSSLNLSPSLLLPYSSALQPVAPVQPLGAAPSAQQPPPSILSSPPFAGLQPQPRGAGEAAGSAVGGVSNAALLQLQATLLQVAQTGNQQAIQQLQGLNALMQQAQQTSAAQQAPQPQPPQLPSQPQAAPAPLSSATAPLLLPIGPFTSGSPAPGSDASGYSSNGAGHRSASVSPLVEGQREVSPLTSHRLGNPSGSSAFKPRGKRDREDGQDLGYVSTSASTGSSGGNSSSGSGAGNGSGSPSPALHPRHLSGGRVGRPPSLKTSVLRADVREAVAAAHLLDKAAAKEKAKAAGSSRDDSSGGSSSGAKSSSSDEEQRSQEADDETESEERNTKRRRRKPTTPPSAHKPQHHPFHLFSTLEGVLPQQTQSQQPSSQLTSNPAMPPVDLSLLGSKEQQANALYQLYLPQTTTAPSSLPISQQLSHLGISDAVNASASEAEKSQRAAALSALSSFLHSNASIGALPPQQSLLGGNDSQNQQLHLLHQLQLQQQQQQQQQMRQLSAPSAIASGPTQQLHGIPLQMVSQHFAGQHQTHSAHGAGDSTSSGSGSSPSGGLHRPSSLPLDSMFSPQSGVLGAGSTPGSGKKLRKKHIVTDRQRRAKIKGGMEQLRGLLSSQGSFTTDQVSIMMASVQLIQKLREELSALKSHTEQMRSELERYKTQFGSIAGVPNTQGESTAMLSAVLGIDPAQLAALGVDSPPSLVSSESGDSPSGDSAMAGKGEENGGGSEDGVAGDCHHLRVKGESSASDSSPATSPSSSASRASPPVGSMAAMSIGTEGAAASCADDGDSQDGSNSGSDGNASSTQSQSSATAAEDHSPESHAPMVTSA